MRRLLPICLAFAAILHAQSTDASLAGRVTDPSTAMIAGANVSAINVGQNFRYQTTTNNSGEYSLPNLPPGTYRLEVEKSGFKKLIKPDVFLHVQDRLEINFAMTVGAASETITVESGAPLLNTSGASVSTLIDNRFVENMPLNGRSFSSLLDLTPGVVLIPSNFQEQGQFSVNGQRPDANYFTVDGVSANLGNAGGGSSLGQGGAGQLPTTSAFGGTSNLVSLDALQEFRVQTSTFAPEYGRTPGAQISVVTKSGVNALHGTAFEYFRNDVLDANDWFADNEGVKKPALRQNDFGGVLGGRIIKDRLFFFGSYEGLRVRQPQVANAHVPMLATIQSAPAAVQPLLNAFPKPNGAPCPNCPPGTAGFSAGYSDPSSLNAGSIRVDYVPANKITIFGRYNYAPSNTALRGTTEAYAYSDVQKTKFNFQNLTLGMNLAIMPQLTNELRFNYSRSRGESLLVLDNFGGAVPPSQAELYPSLPPPPPSFFLFYADTTRYGLTYSVGPLGNNLEQQIQVTDNLTRTFGTHQLKCGVDYRRPKATQNLFAYELAYEFLSLSNVLANNVPVAAVVSRTRGEQLVFPNWSVFAQDTWNATRNLTVTYGLRWEYNAAPSSPNGTLPFTANGVSDLATMTLASAGTPLWHAQKDDFAPRLGIAWNPRSNFVIRAGAGIFYDLGYSTAAIGMSAFPYAQERVIPGTSFPLNVGNAMPPPFTTSPPVPFLSVVDPNHVLPRTYQWNTAMEQGFRNTDVLTLTYLGAAGRKLMRRDISYAPNSNFTGEFDVLNNGGDSNYNALQAQYRHRLRHRLQTLLSYTWAHTIDNVSSDGNFANVPPGAEPASLDRGPSDYDIRHTFSGALSYDIPGPGSGVLKQVFGNWSTDSIIYARSAPPVNVVTGSNPFPSTLLFGANSVQRPNVVPGQPFYLYQSGAPGGKIINVAAFCASPSCLPPLPPTAQGDLGRNALRGFAVTQWDITIRRQFRFTERFSLQARGDFFNILNHPNFGSPTNYLSAQSPTPFGYASHMLANYLGGGGQNGGLNPLYQIGGPRSIQLALKLQF
jgi:hypothetical protein